MSDAGSCSDWETGAPVNLDKIRDKDEQYWNTYRGTPKAFISNSTGRKIWDNVFGHATSFRFSADSGSLTDVKTTLIKSLSPTANGLVVRDVYTEGKSAAANLP
jgi:putative ABC transport system permease protein